MMELFIKYNWKKIDDNTYVAAKWPQFFYYHNLQNGYIIVFEYNKNSTFDVSIFDHFAIEVMYESDMFEEETSGSGNPVFRITVEANRDGH